MGDKNSLLSKVFGLVLETRDKKLGGRPASSLPTRVFTHNSSNLSSNNVRTR
jgi:hypothetical protein